MKVLIATTNLSKKKEMDILLAPLGFECINLMQVDEFGGPDGVPEAPEDFDTFEGNAISKAKYYADIAKIPTIAEDSGIVVEALDGWPGVISARIAPTDGSRNAEVIRKLHGKTGDDRAAKFVSVAAYYDPSTGETMTFAGECHGLVLETEVGENGFGYDPIFYYPEYQKSFGEVSQEQKNAVSHRGKSFTALTEWLKTKA